MAMRTDSARAVEDELRRTAAALSEALAQPRKDYSEDELAPGQHAAALRRATLDLSRALARLRKGQ